MEYAQWQLTGGGGATGWTTADLSDAAVVKQDPNGLINTGLSTLGTTSTISLNPGHAGTVEGSGTRGCGEVPAFLVPIYAGSDVYSKYSGVALRLSMTISAANAAAVRWWRVFIGYSDRSSGVVAQQGAVSVVYLTQTNAVGKLRLGMPGGTLTNGTACDDWSLFGLSSSLDATVAWTIDTAGQTGPEGRGITSSSINAPRTESSIGSMTFNPSSSWQTGDACAVVGFDINNSGTSSAPIDQATVTGLKLDYQLLERLT